MANVTVFTKSSLKWQKYSQHQLSPLRHSYPPSNAWPRCKQNNVQLNASPTKSIIRLLIDRATPHYASVLITWPALETQLWQKIPTVMTLVEESQMMKITKLQNHCWMLFSSFKSLRLCSLFKVKAIVLSGWCLQWCAWRITNCWAWKLNTPTTACSCTVYISIQEDCSWNDSMFSHSKGMQSIILMFCCLSSLLCKNTIFLTVRKNVNIPSTQKYVYFNV